MKQLLLILVCALILSSGIAQISQYGTAGAIPTDVANGNAIYGFMIDASWKSRVSMAGDTWKGTENVSGTVFYNETLNKDAMSNTIAEIKKNKNGLMAAFPQYTDRINRHLKQMDCVLNWMKIGSSFLQTYLLKNNFS